MIDFDRSTTILGTIYYVNGEGKAIHSHNIANISDLSETERKSVLEQYNVQRHCETGENETGSV